MTNRILLAIGGSLLLSCSEYGYTSKIQTDVFQQVRRNTVDILLVVDNSCSMWEEQDKLAANFEHFITAFSGVDVDWQIGVVSTDTFRAEVPGALLGGSDEVVLEACKFCNFDVEMTDSGGDGWGDAFLRLSIDGVESRDISLADLESGSDVIDFTCGEDMTLEYFAGSNDDDHGFVLTDTDGLTVWDTEEDGLTNGDMRTFACPLGGRVINQVQWDMDWPTQEGVALQLSTDSYTSNGGAIVGNWCAATEIYGDGDFGTPGIENQLCDPSSTPWTPPAASGETHEPGVGDVLITEIMMDPSSVSDQLGEWVELSNVSEHILDLSGLMITDEGQNMAVLPNGTLLEHGQRLVVGRSSDSTQNGGLDIDVDVAADMTLNNSVTFIRSDMDSASEIFAENVVLGVTGSGIEMGLESARLATSEPLLSEDNAGFLREDANLSLIFVSDEDDYSPNSAHTYLRHFTDLKGPEAYRDHSRVRVSAVVGKDKPPYEGEFSCESPDGVGAFGPRYIELATRTEGALESICDDDFSRIATELGLNASGLNLEFALSTPADNTTLSVRLYAEESEESFIKELVQDQDYTYILERNSLLFEIESLPPSEAYIVVEYRVLPEGANLTGSGSGDTASSEGGE